MLALWAGSHLEIMGNNMSLKPIHFVLGVVGFLGFLVLLVLMFGSWGTVDTGHRGVVLRMGAVTGEIKGEGFYGKTPWLESVVDVDVRIQKEEVETSGASKDLQLVHTIVAVNINVKPDSVAELWRTVGPDYKTTIVAPALQESIKSVIAQYTAEELISKRELVREGVSKLVKNKLEPMGIQTDALNIVDFDFSNAFNAAIELKVTAEQNALAAKNMLAQKEFEAQQAVATAKGKAEAMKIEAAALVQNPTIMQLKVLERWDGVLPRVTSGAVPFIDVGKFSESK